MWNPPLGPYEVPVKQIHVKTIYMNMPVGFDAVLFLVMFNTFLPVLRVQSWARFYSRCDSAESKRLMNEI